MDPRKDAMAMAVLRMFLTYGAEFKGDFARIFVRTWSMTANNSFLGFTPTGDMKWCFRGDLLPGDD